MSNGKIDTVDLELIKKLRASQNELYMEMSMNKVESVEVNREINHLIKLFNQSRINVKEYYSNIYKILNPDSLNNSIDKLDSIIDPNQIESSPLQSKKITNLIEFVINYGKSANNRKQQSNNLKQLFIDILTYSIIPSYYNFFWTEYSIKSLYKLFSYLQQKNDDILYDSLARIGFITPCFLHFSQLCFQPIFCELLSSHVNIRNINKENLIRDIQHKIKEYQYLIPDETLVVLACSSNPLRTLVQSFFTVALSTTISSQMFGFFYFSYSKKRFENILGFLKDIFSIKNCDSYIKSIMDAIICDTKIDKTKVKLSRYKEIKKMYSNLFDNVDDFNENNDEYQELNQYQLSLEESNSSDYLGSIYSNNNDDNSDFIDLEMISIEDLQIGNGDLLTVEPIENKYHLFSLSNILNNKIVFQTKLLSSIDIEFIKFASGQLKKFKLPDKIKYFNETKSDIYNIGQQTDKPEDTILSRAILIAPMVRHLLQRADPIPTFKSIPPDIKIIDFIYDFLVKRGDYTYLSERMLQLEQIKTFVPPNHLDQETIKKALSNIGFKRKNPIRVLSNFTSVEKKLLQINEIVGNQIHDIDIIIEANDKVYTQFNAIRKPSEYVKTPNLLVSDLNTAIQKLKLNTDFHKTLNSSKILFAVISEKLDIEEFAVRREKVRKLPHTLKEYDTIFSKDANKHFLDFLRDSFYSHCQGASPEKFNSWGFIAGKITCIEVEKKEITEIIIDACKEISLMRKLERFSIAITTFLNYLSTGFPPGKILDGDQITPSCIALILGINPPMAVTNLAFLHDMMPIELDISVIFGGYASSFPNYLKFAVEQVIPELKDIF